MSITTNDSATFTSRAPRWLRPLLPILNNLEYGTFRIVTADGSVFDFDGKHDGPTGVMLSRDDECFRRIVKDGQIGFAEAYMSQQWDTPDLQALLDMLVQNTGSIRSRIQGKWYVELAQRFGHWLNSNTKRQAKKNIAYHYDLGNDFYSLWLDDSMTYSSAMFDDDNRDLASAQQRKYQSIYDQIGAADGAHLLEVGCGWGGFAEYAAKERGARVTGLTISREQHDFAKERMFRQGLNDRVEIVLRDYRDERGRYDGIASIEMFEAVGENNWPVYFESLRDRLKDDAKATIQTITITDQLFPSYRRNVDFIQKYIFPGGMLPSPSALSSVTGASGLEIVNSIAFGQSYSETLRMWFDRFNAKWDDIAQMGFDERFRRMWNFYLTACAANFRYETTDVIQMTVALK